MPPPSRAANPTTKNKSSQGALSPCLAIAVRLAVATWFCRGLGSVPARPSVRRRSRENDHLAGRRFLSGISASSRGKRRLLGRRRSRRGAVHVTPRLLHTDVRFIQSRSCVSSGAGLLQSERSHRVRCSGALGEAMRSTCYPRRRSRAREVAHPCERMPYEVDLCPARAKRPPRSACAAEGGEPARVRRVRHRLGIRACSFAGIRGR